MLHSIRECAKPVVIAVNGAALGAGLAIVASGRRPHRLGEREPRHAEIDVGLMGGCRHAMRLFSHSLLRRMAFTGMRVNAEELYRRGIIRQCTTRDALVPAALEIATTMASKSPGAASLLKHTMNTIEDMSLRDGYRYEQGMTASISKTDDAKGGARRSSKSAPRTSRDARAHDADTLHIPRRPTGATATANVADFANTIASDSICGGCAGGSSFLYLPRKIGVRRSMNARGLPVILRESASDLPFGPTSRTAPRSPASAALRLRFICARATRGPDASDLASSATSASSDSDAVTRLTGPIARRASWAPSDALVK